MSFGLFSAALLPFISQLSSRVLGSIRVAPNPQWYAQKKFVIPPDKMRGQHGLFFHHCVIPVNKMAKWLGLSLSPWKLCSILSWQPTIGEKKNKTGWGGTVKGAVIEADGTNPDGSCERTLLSSPVPQLICFHESVWTRQSALLQDAAPLMESLRCEENWAAMAPCWSSHQNIPFTQMKASRWAIITGKHRDVKKLSHYFPTELDNRWFVSELQSKTINPDACISTSNWKCKLMSEKKTKFEKKTVKFFTQLLKYNSAMAVKKITKHRFI